MKQHITFKQWNELTLSQQSKWVSFAMKNPDNFLKPKFYHKRNTGMPNIGQMVEFLDEKTNYLQIDYGTPQVGFDPQVHWRVCFQNSQYNFEELCDALWEAVKEVLEK